LGPEPTTTLERDAAATRTVLHTADGVQLIADIRATPDPHAAVVVVHGFTAHRRHASVVAMAGALVDAGYAVVAADGRGHGESDGVCTLGDDERFDVEAAVGAARQLDDRVVVVGASMGAIAALRYAAGATDLAGVVSVSCPARWQLRSLRSAFAAGLTQTRPGRWFLLRSAGVRVVSKWQRPEPPASLAARVECPLAIVHGLADRFLPALEARHLHGSATGPRRLDLVPAMGHAFDASGTATIVAAVGWCLGAENDGMT
jgi:pimeloyl-ACP methyl ester carboxylesterase